MEATAAAEVDAVKVDALHCQEMRTTGMHGGPGYDLRLSLAVVFVTANGTWNVGAASWPGTMEESGRIPEE